MITIDISHEEVSYAVVGLLMVILYCCFTAQEKVSRLDIVLGFLMMLFWPVVLAYWSIGPLFAKRKKNDESNKTHWN